MAKLDIHTVVFVSGPAMGYSEQVDMSDKDKIVLRGMEHKLVKEDGDKREYVACGWAKEGN
jgi:hypothetical protein